MESNIQSIAIIGGGPAGLAVLNELLHVHANGRSTIHDPEGKFPNEPRFKDIVLFERNGAAGGVWRYSSNTGPELNSDITANNDFNNPWVIYSQTPIPSELDDLKQFSHDEPLEIPLGLNVYPPPLEWYQNAVYSSLYTNTPELLMRFSYQPRAKAKASNISPFIRHNEVLSNMESLSTTIELDKCIRYNSSVQRLTKVESGAKWEVAVREFDAKRANYNWYTQKFDAVVIASGRQHYPHYPVIDGLAEVINTTPQCISHSKNFRSPDKFKNKVNIIELRRCGC